MGNLAMPKVECRNFNNDRTYIVTELCPHCGCEIEMRWNSDIDGFKAFCPVCGKRLMLCDECRHAEDARGCDYDCKTDTCFRNKETQEISHEAFTMMVFALRYAVGRDAYTFRRVCEYVAGEAKNMTVNQRKVITQELDEFDEERGQPWGYTSRTEWLAGEKLREVVK